MSKSIAEIRQATGAASFHEAVLAPEADVLDLVATWKDRVVPHWSGSLTWDLVTRLSDEVRSLRLAALPGQH
jgi:hypothetical protein